MAVIMQDVFLSCDYQGIILFDHSRFCLNACCKLWACAAFRICGVGLLFCLRQGCDYFIVHVVPRGMLCMRCKVGRCAAVICMVLHVALCILVQFFSA